MFQLLSFSFFRFGMGPQNFISTSFPSAAEVDDLGTTGLDYRECEIDELEKKLLSFEALLSLS